MDSGNSGSMHSSSAGDDEYDSRATSATDTLSSFLNTNSFHSLPPVSLSSSTSLNPHPPTLFDPFSHSYNIDPVWPDPTQPQNYHNTLPAQFGPTTGPPTETITSSKPALGPIRNPRKRTRASRRAPTTVLTTDTSNFRQMVQEFTGIPAPPFSATSSPSSPYSRRLDLFGQLYPFRPSALKVSTANIATATPNISTIATPGTNNNIFTNPFNNQFLLPNNNNNNNSSSMGGFTSTNSLMFGLSKSTNQENSLVEMGITQDHINANLSAFLSDSKGIGRENNGDGAQENNVRVTQNEENTVNSWNYRQGL